VEVCEVMARASADWVGQSKQALSFLADLLPARSFASHWVKLPMLDLVWMLQR
jgi:hypothetical protein